MPRRRRPLMPEERDQRRLNRGALETGRGQANARAVLNNVGRTKVIEPVGGGMEFIYEGSAWYLRVDYVGGAVAAGGISNQTIASHAFSSGDPSDWATVGTAVVINTAGLYLWAPSLIVTGTAGSIIALNDDSTHQVVSGGTDLAPGGSTGTTVPFKVGQTVPAPFIRNKSAASMTVSAHSLYLYPVAFA